VELLTALAVFLSPYLIKAGEKVSEKTVETLFESRFDLVEKFKDLFQDEIITLGLNETSNFEETTKLLEANPEVIETIRQKVETNQDLLNDLVKTSQLINRPEFKGLQINAEKIGQININSTVSQNITNF
jgi:hypothetical protein